MAEQDLMTEDWKKEFEKVILTKKYARASSVIGLASSEPNLLNLKMAYGNVLDYVTAIPVSQDLDRVAIRKGFIDKLDKIGLILNGSTTNELTLNAMRDYKVFLSPERDGVRTIQALQNLPTLVNAIRDILIEAGEFSTQIGMRVSLSKKRKYGKERLLEEEEFEDLET